MPSANTMFTASPPPGTLAGFQLPGTFQFPVPSFQFLAKTVVAKKKTTTTDKKYLYINNCFQESDIVLRHAVQHRRNVEMGVNPSLHKYISPNPGNRGGASRRSENIGCSPTLANSH